MSISNKKPKKLVSIIDQQPSARTKDCMAALPSDLDPCTINVKYELDESKNRFIFEGNKQKDSWQQENNAAEQVIELRAQLQNNYFAQKQLERFKPNKFKKSEEKEQNRETVRKLRTKPTYAISDRRCWFHCCYCFFCFCTIPPCCSDDDSNKLDSQEKFQSCCQVIKSSENPGIIDFNGKKSNDAPFRPTVLTEHHREKIYFNKDDNQLKKKEQNQFIIDDHHHHDEKIILKASENFFLLRKSPKTEKVLKKSRGGGGSEKKNPKQSKSKKNKTTTINEPNVEPGKNKALLLKKTTTKNINKNKNNHRNHHHPQSGNKNELSSPSSRSSRNKPTIIKKQTNIIRIDGPKSRSPTIIMNRKHLNKHKKLRDNKKRQHSVEENRPQFD